VKPEVDSRRPSPQVLFCNRVRKRERERERDEEFSGSRDGVSFQGRYRGKCDVRGAHAVKNEFFIRFYFGMALT
jgi:hypothetical protein